LIPCAATVIVGCAGARIGHWRFTNRGALTDGQSANPWPSPIGLGTCTPKVVPQKCVALVRQNRKEP